MARIVRRTAAAAHGNLPGLAHVGVGAQHRLVAARKVRLPAILTVSFLPVVAVTVADLLDLLMACAVPRLCPNSYQM